MFRAITTLIIIIISLCCEFGCTPNDTKKTTVIIDTLSIQNLDITIPGSFSSQVDLHFDSLLIDTFLLKYKNFKVVKSELKQFYSSKKFAYAWFDNNGLTEQAEHLYNRVIHLKKDGLPDSTLYQTLLTSMFENITATEINSEVDIMLTAQYFFYSQLIYNGLPESITKSLQWFLPRKQIALSKLLDSLLQSPSVNIFTNEPIYRQYHLLKNQLAFYRQLSTSDNEEIIVPSKKKYKSGDSSSVILTIRNKLEKLGDLANNNKSFILDSALLVAIKQFQKRHGLNETGIINVEFLNELNVPTNVRIRQIIVNMERCRWFPEKLDKEHLIVNIPEFSLHNYFNDSILWSMKVVVGRELRKTVVFNDQITYLVFSPYWNIPPGILRKDILPVMKQNKNYLDENNMEITGYDGKTPRIRQKPGKNNPLGGVKFIFPNSYSVYLHDTPSKSLFEKANRALSSGCIRLEDAEKLARYLLRHQPEWTDMKIISAMNSGNEQYVNLKQSMPIYLVYFTSWVDHSGKLNFRKDLYNRDKKLDELIIK